jgi:hypothetical protein
MSEQFAPAPEAQHFLRDHCQKRQAAIERSLPAKEVAELRSRFESELAFGEAYQRDYQAYEEEKIKSGADLNDPHFYDAFHAGRGPIASPVGPEEWYAGAIQSRQTAAKFRAFWEWGLLSGGAAVFCIALVVRWLSRPRRSIGREVTSPS